MKSFLKIFLAASLAIPCFAGAQRSQAAIDLEKYVYPNNRAPRPQSFTYATDSEGGYLLLSADGRSVERYDLHSGKLLGTVFDVATARETALAQISGFTPSPDGSKLLVYTDEQSIYRRSFTARYYVYELRSRLLTPLSTRFERQRAPLFSPDGRMVAFVGDDNNIYVKKLDYKTEVAVTTDGAVNKVINGVPDWVYEEEFTTDRSMTWSPDNLTLCFLRYDESDVPVYTLPLYQGTCEPMDEYALYPGVYSYKYPVAGANNSKVSVHSYDVENRKLKEITLPDSRIEYIPRIEYAGQDRLMIATLDRDQNHYTIYCANPRSTVVKSVYSESSTAWIAPESYEELTFEGESFVVMSSRSGYMQLYRYSYGGAQIGQLTSGDHDVTAYYGTDARGNVYYQAAAPTPLDRTVYRIDVRKGTVSAMSRTSGTTNADFAPDMTAAVFSFSDSATPPVYTVNNADGKQLRVLEDNAAYAARYANCPRKEFFTMESEGVTLNGYIIRRPDAMNAPVIMYQYSGPGSQSVLNRWEMDWSYYAAEQGYVVVCVDGRGTGGRGRAFSDVVYRRLGHYETIDQLNAARYAASLPYTDGNAIGICGWSYGGYETLMCASASPSTNPYSAAVAIAPVTDWRYYDSVYTERYMLTPQQNHDGYNTSAPINRAGSLSCPLLLMYGTDDDNVHPANTLQYVSTLQSKGILCDMLSFPNKNHSIYGCNARAMVYANMLRFFDRNLK